MLDFHHDEQAHQYQVSQDGQRVGLIDYRLADQVATFTHTETDLSVQGQGIAGKLTQFALDDVRSRGWRLVPRCPYTRSFVERHQEYADLLAD
ncbi:N-acetyltransferase [Naumannella sp. ID2617S]|uniref:GNAT family N-acetyltransferase n=1 Tax=Enemella dayhoffiae TaxID=2016507 RepID=A0A255H491_9ACTN|nr:GNAT family N-acetyltransferase [Enemella dayhoffiae]NNG19525.1 N-acetyltransferase [Naumannella sp. ID2617S]OYO22156.1 GNAT family N-acetyltransferase [Enemella dayhoffiae]